MGLVGARFSTGRMPFLSLNQHRMSLHQSHQLWAFIEYDLQLEGAVVARWMRWMLYFHPVNPRLVPALRYNSLHYITLRLFIVA